ncbi:MAG TPA: sugar nucleotide-binding protein [Aquihabitans sp.]|nr:sugar nucleotide-binding protein [Aquihabitans sp.]
MPSDRPVLLTGASGLLGSWLLRTAPDATDVVALTSTRPVPGVASVAADLRDREATADTVRRAHPRLVLHAAYAKDRASIVDATRHVVEAATSVGAEVLLTSTDAVFSGDGTRRDETSVPDPIFDYGRWKAEAEAIVLAASAHAAVVRLPLLVSVHPDDHVARQIRAAAVSGEPTRWSPDEIRRPAMASEVAAALWRITELPPGGRSGVWHLAGAERLSRHEIAERVVAHLDVTPQSIVAAPIPPGITRPRDLELSDERARAAVDWDPSPILQAAHG